MLDWVLGRDRACRQRYYLLDRLDASALLALTHAFQNGADHVSGYPKIRCVKPRKDFAGRANQSA